MFDDEFNQLSFPLTGRAGSVLGMAGAQCRFAFEISSNQQYGSFVLDNGGFVQ